MNKNLTKALIFASVAGTLATGTVVKSEALQEGKENTKTKNDTDTVYVVQKGDTLSKISSNFYGDTSYSDEIAVYNGLEDPDLILKGQRILLPKVEKLLNIYTIVDDDQAYVIQKGDSIYSICSRYYGDTRKSTMYKLATYNNLSDPDVIRSGNILYLPEYAKLLKVLERDYDKLKEEQKHKKHEHHHEHHHHNQHEYPYYHEINPHRRVLKR